MNRRIRNRTYGGVGGRRARALLLPDLYDKIYRGDILDHAYRLAKANGGIAGVDGVTFEQIESEGREGWLSGIREQLHGKTYKPQPLLRVTIPKPGGGKRPLGIPTIRDRVIQTAAKLVIEPIFEADLEPNTYVYRPKRSAIDAISEVHRLLKEGYADVADADLSKYFDTIPHPALMQCVARRISDRDVLRLIKQWLKAPRSNDENGKDQMSGGRKGQCGTPQGGVISPLLANLYMNRFLKHWRQQGCEDAFKAQVVAYADDFVILSRGWASQALEWTTLSLPLDSPFNLLVFTQPIGEGRCYGTRSQPGFSRIRAAGQDNGNPRP